MAALIVQHRWTLRAPATGFVEFIQDACHDKHDVA